MSKKILISVAAAGLMFASVAFAAANPSGTGQPGAECGEDNALVEPHGFRTDGFANAESRYAGSDESNSLHSNNPKAVSQYDIACFQISNR